MGVSNSTHNRLWKESDGAVVSLREELGDEEQQEGAAQRGEKCIEEGFWQYAQNSGNRAAEDTAQDAHKEIPRATDAIIGHKQFCNQTR